MHKDILVKPAFVLISALSLCACGGMAGKTSASKSASTFSSPLAAGTAVAISSIYPADGYVTEAPTSITVNFSSANLSVAQLSSITGYSLNCGGSSVAAQSVTAIQGVPSVNVTFAANTSLTNGTVCNFQVSNNLKDNLGNFVTGNHAATYTINSSAASGSGGWTASLNTTPTGTAGSMAGSSFSGVGADGMILQGLLVNGSQYVDGIVGVWASRFSATTLSYGLPHGATGSYTQLSCPSGYRITGIHGKAGASIDSVGIICKTENQAQTYRSSTFGGNGGSNFELNCPSGQFATDLNGRAGSYLNQLSLGCR